MGDNGDISLSAEKITGKRKSGSPDAITSEGNSNGCFECNICLENARDPVVTLCGHLYCWPCIYKWIHFRITSTDAVEQPQCPICKADVSTVTLVPLYGRGHSTTGSDPEERKNGLDIPSRPPAYAVQALITTGPRSSQQLQSPDLHQQYYNHHDNHRRGISIGGTMTTHPIVWMFGEMVCATVLGGSAEVSFYGHPTSYQVLENNSNARVRRQQKRAEKSLNRISIFLLCCLILCLLSF